MLRRFDGVERISVIAESGLLSTARRGLGDTAMDASFATGPSNRISVGAHALMASLRPAHVQPGNSVDSLPDKVTSDRLVLRGLDLALACFAIILLAPLMSVIAVVVMAADRGPIFFAHRRLGLGGREFYCYKFRSMRVDADARLRELLAHDPEARAQWEREHKLRNDPRITFVGQFLRKSSLDELPQLFNVVRGDMSLVGPRPIVQAEVVRYGRYISHYFAQKPGMTGLWQVSGRNKTTYRRRVAIDTMQARRMSLSTYFSILARTCIVILTGHGAY